MKHVLPNQRQSVFKKFAPLLPALVVTLVLGLAGCDLWYKDMKGYLEYWTATAGVGDYQVVAEPDSQGDSSGRTTISTGTKLTVTAAIDNPDGHALNNSGVGPASDILKSVRISGPAGAAALSRASVTVGLTSLTFELAPLSSVPTTPESLQVEHKDFTVLLAPVRTETNMSPSNPLPLTFRYNTPPRMPLAVVEDGGVLKFPDSTNPWEVVSGSREPALDDLVFWAYPSGITKQTHPDYVASFRVTDDTDVEENPASAYLMSRESSLQALIPQDIVNAGYEVYCYLAVNGGPVTVEAVDIDGVRGAAITSGQQLHAITLDAAGGAFGTRGDRVTVYRAADSTLTGGDLDVPTKSGYYLSGWTDGTGDVSFPCLASSITGTLTAQWLPEPPSGGSAPVTPPPAVDPYTFSVKPGESLQDALDQIFAANDGSSTYTLLLTENYDGVNSSFLPPGNALVAVSPTKPLNLKIKSDGGPYTINAGSTSTNLGRVLYVDNNANVTLENVILTGGYITEGGGAYVMSGGRLTVGRGAVVSGNTATGDGGGIYSAGELVIDGGSVTNNEASSTSALGSFGGGVHVVSGGSLDLSGTADISNNRAANGAGVSLGMNVVATMNGGTISGNTASSDGGGVYVSSNTSFTITGGIIGGSGSPNSADRNGGGIYIAGNATVSLDGATVSYNTAGTSGGGILNNGTLTMTSGQVSNNEATHNGGGISNNANGTITMSGGSISDNVAKNQGNGIYQNGTFNMGGAATVNLGNAVYLADGKTVTITSELTGSSPVANIVRSTYTVGTQILEAGPGVNLTAAAGQFMVDMDIATGDSPYFVDSNGQLQQQ